MPSPYLIPVLVQLRTEFNELNPKRDKGADGWIGDPAHQAEKSDHNPDSKGRVLALDIDSSGPWASPFGAYVQWIVDRERAGITANLEYVIYNHYIASRDSSWHWVKYTGSSDPHVTHAHFSARHDHVNEGNTRSNLLENVDMDEKTIATAVWGAGLGSGDGRETTANMLARVETIQTNLDSALGKLDNILRLVTQPTGGSTGPVAH